MGTRFNRVKNKLYTKAFATFLAAAYLSRGIYSLLSHIRPKIITVNNSDDKNFFQTSSLKQSGFSAPLADKCTQEIKFEFLRLQLTNIQKSRDRKAKDCG
jgi:hypothetical protein